MTISIKRWLFWKTENSQPNTVAAYESIYQRVTAKLTPEQQKELNELIEFFRSEAECEYIFHNSGADQ